MIDHHCGEAVDKNKIGVILSTDLSLAFDLVDHGILLDKLQYYGIVSKELDLIRSYLSDRTQYTEIQTKSSPVMYSPNCSVVQGSRLSGLLYTIYTNEVPLPHKLMEDGDWMEKNLKETPTNYTEIDHDTVNFVDDSNSVIAFKNPDEVTFNINRFFSVLKIYYNDMKLSLNPDKTNLLVISKPSLRQFTNDIRIEDDEEVIKPKQQIRILGWLVNTRLSMDSSINATISSINSVLNSVKEIQKYMNELH